MHSRTIALAALAAGLAGLAGCNCSELPEGGEADAAVPVCDPACAEGQTCAAASLTCVKALHEGQVCGTAADGTAVEGACENGLSCGSVGALTRCSRECTSANADEVCGAVRQCFARPGASISGFCGTAAGEGQTCGDAELLKCTGGDLVCINGGADTLGKCFKYCDPTGADPNPECSTGQSCADLFADAPTEGVCVVPAGRYPATCDYATLVYCGRGEVCVRPGDETWGYCHTRCSASSAAACASGEECAQPSSGLYLCVSPVARCAGSDPSACAHCSASEDRYCGADDLCVRLGSSDSAVCKQDCTGGKACAQGTCTALTGSDRSVCLD